MQRHRLGCAALLAGSCASVSAHSPVPGIGHFYAGMLHPVLVPAHLIALLAAGLWLGLRWPAGREGVVALVLSLPVGLLVGTQAMWSWAEQVILLLGAVAALATAVGRSLPAGPVAVVAAVLGFSLGLDSQPDGVSGSPRWLFLSGAWLGALVGLAFLVTLGELGRRPWVRMALRVVASWVAAVSIIVLALAWKGAAPPASPREIGDSAADHDASSPLRVTQRAYNRRIKQACSLSCH